MKLFAEIGGKKYAVDLKNPIDISIPVSFDKKQLKAFGSAPTRREAYKAGSFVGDVRRGGSCNCELYTFSPHLHGTHTECIGHITKERISVHEIVDESLVPATLITIQPVKAKLSKDTYNPKSCPDDFLITGDALKKALAKAEKGFLAGLIIRTLPNDKNKTTRNYDRMPPPYFSNEAMRYIASLGVRHLLVDFPSVDRPDDEGKLSNHRIFWQKGRRNTITELAYIANKIADGGYLLNLQVAAFEADAAPSRPVLYKVKR